MEKRRIPQAERIEQLDLLMKPRPPHRGVEGLAITRVETDESNNVTVLVTEPDSGQPAAETTDDESEALFSYWAKHA